MECPNCQSQLKDSAKFCGKCGTKIEQAPVETDKSENVCIHCGNSLKPGAKFCGKCGKAQSEQKPSGEKEPAHKGYIMWEMQPGQIAMRLTEAVFSEYNKANGVVIPEGYLAMVMVGGKLQSMLEAGVYKFDKKVQEKTDLVSRIGQLFSGLFSGRKKQNNEQNQRDLDHITQAVQKRIPVEIVVCRSASFTLPFTFSEVPTKSIRVNTGIVLSLQVSNLLALYKAHLLDRTILAADVLAKALMPFLQDAVHLVSRDYEPEKIALDEDYKARLSAKFTDIFNQHFQFFELLGLVKVETGREELQRLEQLSEEMYLSERELEQLGRRNEFMNRLAQEQNSAELQNAENAAEFNRRLAEINKDNLLSQEEFMLVQREIQERSEDHEFDRARAMELMVAQHQYDLRAASVKMEEDLGGRLFNLQQERKRKEDEYQDERRRREMEMDKEEQLGQLDLLKQAQEIRQQREQAEHDRKLEAQKQDQMHELDKLNVYAGMTAEQIMVANPAISAEAAKAMAEKFKAEAAVMASDTRAEDAKDQMRMMKEFMEQQMQAVRDMSASNAQAMNGMLQSKEREIERTQQMADKNEDRYAGVVREQIKADRNSEKKVCKACGQETDEESFCPDCGARLS